MRHVLCATSILLALTAAGQAANAVTLLIQFDSRHSQESVEAMKAELSTLMKNTALDWRMLDDVRSGETFPDLVVVKFRGACEMNGISAFTPIAPYLLDERGPYAITRTADGQVLPFSEVECDRIKRGIRPAMWGTDYKRADILLGRALGRVLAHELHHVLAKTKAHEHTGINQRALTGAQLIRDELP